MADTISLNPAGFCERDTKELFKPKELMVVAINPGIDDSIERSLKDLATFQARDKSNKNLLKLWGAGKNVVLQNNILYSKDSYKYPYWRPVLPTDLEIPVIRYVHTSFGHLGTEKCIVQVSNTFHVKGLDGKSGGLLLYVVLANRLNIQIGVVQYRT